MALVVTSRGSGNHNSSATSFTLSPASNLAAGSMAVLCVAADNSVNGGATNNFTTVTDSIGNTWSKRRSPVFDNGATSAGVQGAIYTTQQNIGPLLTGTVVTVNFGDATTAKTWTLTEIVPTAGNTVVFRTGGDKSAGGTGTVLAMGASATVQVGEVILAAFFLESGTTQTASTPDADVTNGSWTTNQYNEIGSTTTGSGIISQAKIQTTTPSTQSYDVTVGISSDYHGSYIIVTDTLPARSASVAHTQDADTNVVTSTAAVAAASSSTQAADTNVITATVSALAAVSATQAADTNVVTATVPALAAISFAQAADTASITVITVAPEREAVVSFTQASDAAVVAATAAVAVSASIAQASDTNAITATVPALASANLTQAADTAAVTATARVSASASHTQAADAVAVSATVPALASVSLSQAEDATISAATSIVTSEATAWLTQADDVVALTSTADIVALLVIAQAADSNAITATSIAPGQLVATGITERRRSLSRRGLQHTTFRPGRTRR